VFVKCFPKTINPKIIKDPQPYHQRHSILKLPLLVSQDSAH